MKVCKGLGLWKTCLKYLCITMTCIGILNAEASPRILAMKEVMRLTDESGQFTFKHPYHIATMEDGDVFVADDEALHHFDSRGTYLGNLVRKGEGPGEVKYYGGYSLDDGRIYIKSVWPVKILTFTKSHRLESEIRIDGLGRIIDHLFSFRKQHYFFENNPDFKTMKSGKYNSEYTLASVDSRAEVERTGLKFAVPSAALKSEGHVRSTSIAYLVSAFDGRRYLYVSHEERYNVYRIDLDSRKIVMKYTRNFSPAAYRPRMDLARTDPDYKRYLELEEIADRKYFGDIMALHCLGADLLVFTSQLDNEKRVLVDRYNHSGELVDTFYLPLQGINRPDDILGRPLFFDKDQLWTSIVDDDDNPVVVQYRLDWKGREK